MKLIFCAVLALAALVVTASAKPRVAFDTVARDSDAPAETATIGRAHATSDVGVPTTAYIGAFEYTATATLRRHGLVHLSVTVLEHYGNGRNHTFGPYERNLTPGDTFDLTLGEIFFSTKTTVK